jgi:ribonuclease P protein component
MKRLLREVFRLNKSKLPNGVDLVFSARFGAGLPVGKRAKPRYQAIESAVLTLWTQAKLLPPSPGL